MRQFVFLLFVISGNFPRAATLLGSEIDLLLRGIKFKALLLFLVLKARNLIISNPSTRGVLFIFCIVAKNNVKKLSVIALILLLPVVD